MFLDTRNTTIATLPARYYESKDNIDELLNDIVASRDRMFDEFYIQIDDVYFPLVNPIGRNGRKYEIIEAASKFCS